jgi:transcriptional regulator with XRE-family HTH domain
MKNSHSMIASPGGEADAVQFLTDQYLSKKEDHGSYSLRDFAKEIGVSPAQLSQMLSRQRPVTYRQMSRILSALNIENTVADKIISGIILKAGKTAKVSKKVRDQANSDLNSVNDQNISFFPIQKFKFISQWYHFAILELT